MRIFVVGTGQIDSAAMSCEVALRSLGHEVVLFDPDAYPRPVAAFRNTYLAKAYVNTALQLAGVYQRLFERSLLSEIARFQPEVVLVIPIFSVGIEAVARLKRDGVKVAGWFQDAVSNMGSHKFLLADYDGLFFKDPYIVDRLRDGAGLEHVHYLPEACEPATHHSLPLTAADRARYGCELAVYGNLYAYRARLLEYVLDYDLNIYGHKPSRWMTPALVARWRGYPVFREEKIRAVLAAKICLSTSHYAEVRSANARIFEIAGIGGFQVADAPGVPEFFQPGTEIVTFKGPREMREVIQHYLAHPDERAEIARRGQARAHRDHTFAKRLRQLLTVIGLSDAEAAPALQNV
jgi:spore maturation protein CgeB